MEYSILNKFTFWLFQNIIKALNKVKQSILTLLESANPTLFAQFTWFSGQSFWRTSLPCCIARIPQRCALLFSSHCLR